MLLSLPWQAKSSLFLPLQFAFHCHYHAAQIDFSHTCNNCFLKATHCMLPYFAPFLPNIYSLYITVLLLQFMFQISPQRFQLSAMLFSIFSDTFCTFNLLFLQTCTLPVSNRHLSCLDFSSTPPNIFDAPFFHILLLPLLLTIKSPLQPKLKLTDVKTFLFPTVAQWIQAVATNPALCRKKPSATPKSPPSQKTHRRPKTPWS